MPSSKKSTTPKSAKSTSSKKTVAAVPASEPVVVAPVVVAPPVELTESTETVEDVPLDQQFKDILTRIQEFRTLATSLTADVRKLQKNVAREVRESNKKNRKRRVRTGDDKRPPSGFAKPALISDSLCQFLGKPSGTEMARTEVTKYLTQYIKAHALQDAENKRRINCDSALKSLLNVSDGDEVTYFNLQRYMKPHFPTSAANLAAAAAALAAASN
jgi:chromatin remodeling complex protein RSC6